MTIPNLAAAGEVLEKLEWVRAARSAFNMEELDGVGDCDMCGRQDVGCASLVGLPIPEDVEIVFDQLCEGCVIEQWFILAAEKAGVPSHFRILNDVTNNR